MPYGDQKAPGTRLMGGATPRPPTRPNLQPTRQNPIDPRMRGPAAPAGPPQPSYPAPAPRPMPQGQPFQAGFTPPPNAQGVPFQGGGFAPPGLSQGGDPLFAGPPIQPNVPPATGQGIPFQNPGGFMPPGLGMRAGMGQPNQTALMMGLLQMLARRGGGGLGGGGFGQGSGMGGGQFGGF